MKENALNVEEVKVITADYGTLVRRNQLQKRVGSKRQGLFSLMVTIAVSHMTPWGVLLIRLSCFFSSPSGTVSFDARLTGHWGGLVFRYFGPSHHRFLSAFSSTVKVCWILFRWNIPPLRWECVRKVEYHENRAYHLLMFWM